MSGKIDHATSISTRFTEKKEKKKKRRRTNLRERDNCYSEHVIECIVINIIKEQLSCTNTIFLDKVLVSWYWKKQTKKGHLFAKYILDNVLVILRKLCRKWESEEFPLIIDKSTRNHFTLR